MAMERQDYPAILVGAASFELDDSVVLGVAILMLRIAPTSAGAGS
jgi:hypothetical protein